MNKQFTQYVAEDFVMEDSFRSWVLESGSPHQFFWEKYQVQHPHQMSEILDARNLVLVLDGLQQVTPDQETVDTMWQKIVSAINAQPEEKRYSTCLA